MDPVFIFMICVCLVSLYVPCVRRIPTRPDQKGKLELELHVIMSHYVGRGNHWAISVAQLIVACFFLIVLNTLWMHFFGFGFFVFCFFGLFPTFALQPKNLTPLRLELSCFVQFCLLHWQFFLTQKCSVYKKEYMINCVKLPGLEIFPIYT